MDASCEKQIAFNKLILVNEDEIAEINSSPPDFLMATDFTTATYVAIGVGHKTMGTQQICEQLLVQGDRRMTAASTIIHNTGYSREVVALAGILAVLT
jgi:hypothetical protein